MAEVKAANTKNGYHTGKFERFSYGLYFFGQIIFYGIVASFLSLYLTDSGVPAVIVSAIFAVAKVWDAINDPIFGIVVDKATLKRGKYIPWIRLSSILIPLSTIFMFAMPMGVSVQVKTIWAVIAYVIWDASYTLCDVPIYALATSMTDNFNERNGLYLVNRLFMFFGMLLSLMAIPLLYPNIGWTATAVIMAIVGFVTMAPVGYTAKERFFVREENQESPSLKSLVRYLFKNKYLLIFNGAIIVSSLTNTGGAVGNYVAIYCLGGTQWIAILSLISAIPLLIAMLISQQIIKKIDKFTVYIWSTGISVVLHFVTYFVGYHNITAFIILGIIKGLFAGATVLSVLFIADCAEYGHFITGDRAQGVTFSIQTFTSKITGALSGTIGMLVLGMVGFVSGAGAVQSPNTIAWIWKLSTLVPTISAAAAFFVLLFGYKLRTSDAKLMMQVNMGEITREEAEAKFSRKY